MTEMSPPLESVAPKPWWQSRTIIGIAVTLVAQLLSRYGVTVTPELQGEAVSAILDLMTAAGAGLAVYGRISASQPIAPVKPGATIKALAIVGVLGALTLGGPSACASQVETQTPAQAAYALRTDLVAAQVAAIEVLSGGGVDPAIARGIAATESAAYAAVTAAEAAARRGDGMAAAAALAAGEVALGQLWQVVARQEAR